MQWIGATYIDKGRSFHGHALGRYGADYRARRRADHSRSHRCGASECRRTESPASDGRKYRGPDARRGARNDRRLDDRQRSDFPRGEEQYPRRLYGRSGRHDTLLERSARLPVASGVFGRRSIGRRQHPLGRFGKGNLLRGGEPCSGQHLWRPLPKLSKRRFRPG